MANLPKTERTMDMTLREELAKMSPHDKVCVRTVNGIFCNGKVKKIKKTMNYYMDYDVIKKVESYDSKPFYKSLVKSITIYI